MQSTTVIYIVLAVLASVLVAFFQYFYNIKKQPKVTILLFALRALSLFLLGLLLINPTIDIVSTENIKPQLAVLVDNSLSTKYFQEEQTVFNFLNSVKNNKEIEKKFEVSMLSFSDDTKLLDSLSFEGKNTDIDQAIKSVKELYKGKKVATVILTDGNQTKGNDYEFSTSKNKIYPIVIGDTTKYQDLQITQLNVNKYSYIKNNFPVEAMLLYEGDEPITSNFTLTHKGKKVYSQKLSFSPDNPTQTIKVNLTSKAKGLQYYSASIAKLSNEKNTKNNYKNFSVEVIDEQTKVLVLSSIMHPDLGVLKKSIESNKQRKVDIRLINNKQVNYEEYQMFVFYQPTAYFRNIIEQIKGDCLIISGTKTDWSFLNSLNLGLTKNAINQSESYGAIYNDQFLTFLQKNIDFEDFPPLEDKFGKINLTKETQILLHQKIGGVASEQPLLATIEQNDTKYAFLFGEGLWKWRAASYLKNQSFENFDAFIGNLTQYLASSKKRKRLEVKIKSIYPANSPIDIAAFYVDKNYKFDNRADLELKIINTVTKEVKSVPFSLIGNAYQVAVEGLVAGEYSYQVSVKNQAIKKFGRFKITAYQVEEQFINANKGKLQRLADNTQGKLYYSNQIESLMSELLNDSSYFTTQKSITKQKNLIDWKWILMVVVALLAIEWFLRKYYGKI
ncbi:vWA domain-containing protein [Tenacibaculum sp. 190524A02b]|uniref:vWA domain-containing protein n=1 Tax=Tenacibaculum vairaonense TaxID=3137860 RepID=UPI0031FAE5F1